ncbi:MAG TPA: DegT/DnrJ/EryC1/StrS family aminotransferase [Gemmatimonadales bacterium]
MNPFKVIQDFEAALCEYTGAPYCVTTTSCTMALLLATAYWVGRARFSERTHNVERKLLVEIPKRTYVGVPMSIIHAGGWPTFRDLNWRGGYQMLPMPVWDSARWFTEGLFHRYIFPGQEPQPGTMICVSFHWNKTLGIQQGGAILHDDPEADAWLRRARFDGRKEGVPPSQDTFPILGWHAYMAPETAAAGLVRLANLPRNNPPLPGDDYPDLSALDIFK